MLKIIGKKKIEVDEYKNFCDFCGKAMDAGENNCNKDALECSGKFVFDFGYFSNRDGQSFEWDACNLCADSISKTLDNLRSK